MGLKHWYNGFLEKCVHTLHPKEALGDPFGAPHVSGADLQIHDCGLMPTIYPSLAERIGK